MYDKHCLSLSKEEIEANLSAGKPYVIRQNIPNEGTTTFHDELYGNITVENAELDDMIPDQIRRISDLQFCKRGR